MKTIAELPFNSFASLYCDAKCFTPERLKSTLLSLATKFQPTGFMLLRCEMLDSSALGNRTILPYGPQNTYKTIPDHPISPSGLASDMSVVEATLSTA